VFLSQSLSLSSNISGPGKANTLAFYSTELIRGVKIFIAEVPKVHTLEDLSSISLQQALFYILKVLI